MPIDRVFSEVLDDLPAVSGLRERPFVSAAVAAEHLTVRSFAGDRLLCGTAVRTGRRTPMQREAEHPENGRGGEPDRQDADHEAH